MAEVTEMTLDPLKLVGTFIGNYAVVDYLATGGTSHIYLGQLHSTMVVIKLLKPELSREPDARRRFHKEAYVHKKFDHPNIIKLFYVGRFKNEPFMVLEYAPDGSLQDYVEQFYQNLKLGDIAIIIQQIAAALHHLHENNIIHRDVKPGNIMMRNIHDSALADFGIVRTEDVNMRFAVQPGTLDFMAPEQIEGLDADFTTDQFALGVLTYWLLTGEKPFTADTREEAALQRKVGAIAPHDYNYRLPEELSEIILRAMHFKMEERFTFIEEFAHLFAQTIEKYNLQDLPAFGAHIPPANISSGKKSLSDTGKSRNKTSRFRSLMEPYGWISLSILGLMMLIVAFNSTSRARTTGMTSVRPAQHVLIDLRSITLVYEDFDCAVFVPLYNEMSGQVTLNNADYTGLAELTITGSPTKTVYSNYCLNENSAGQMNPDLWNAMRYELNNIEQ